MKIAEQDHAEEAQLIPRLLGGLVAIACRYPWSVLTASACLVAFSLCSAYARLEYRTSRNDLINPHKECQRRWQDYLREFGNDDDIVVVVEGTNRARMEQALEAFAAGVSRHPELFDRLFYKVDLRPLRERALLYLSPRELAAIQEHLRKMGPLLELGPLSWRILSLSNLLLEADRRAALLPSSVSLAPVEVAFWRQLSAICSSAHTFLDDPNAYHSPWTSLTPADSAQTEELTRPRYFFSTDGSLAFLLVRPTLEAGSFTAARKSVDLLREKAAQLRERFPDLRFGLTGMPVLETDEMTATQEDTTRAGWLALAGVTLLYLVVYRGLRYPFLTVATLLVGTIWALGWLTWTVGHLNLLSATFAIMLIGMGDYGVLWVTRYEQERAAGRDESAAMHQTALGVGAGILTAAVTTAVAFFTAMLADFQAVLELGWIAGSGVLLCALACFTTLPALLVLTERWFGARSERKPATLPFPGPHTAWLPFLARRPLLVVGATLAATVVVGLGSWWVRYDHNLLHMQAHGLESVQWELKLIERTAGASWHTLSYRANREEVLALKARFEQLPEVSRVAEVASLIPAEQEKKLPLLRDIQHRLRRLPERGTVFTPFVTSPTALRESLQTLRKRVREQAEGESVFAEFRPRLHGLLVRLESLGAEDAARRLQEYDRRLVGDLLEGLHRLREVAEPRSIGLDDLPAALRERYVSPNGQWLLRVFARDCLWDFEPLERFVRQVAAVDAEATGKPFTTREGLAAMKEGFQWAAVYALGAIVLVLLLDFRSVRHTLMALAPLAIGVVLSLGVMGYCGVPLNPANMIAFPLILGVGVDNGVHVLHDYLTRRPGTPYTLSRSTGRGMLVAALTTVLGFGALMIAQHRGQVGLGFTLSLGVACCMVASLVFLPALLRLLSMGKKSPELPVANFAAPLRRVA